ncbi:MAG: hypothetical protein MJY89_02040 [Bacteroidales bacterium]|nr:hypothetical protein [Bacteroidales bacterium]
MSISRTCFLSFALALLSLAAGAQSFTLPYSPERGLKGSTKSEREMLLGNTIDMDSIPMEYNGFNDEKFKQMDEEMKERQWHSEDTAWERACELDTKEAYRRYIAIFPNGQHRGEANRRFIDREVNDIMSDAHEDLPGIEHVAFDDESPSSTILVENRTEYVLTVYFSGIDSKSVLINPWGRSAVTLTNGTYKIAASVPPAHIHPYAGSTQLSGGRYETRFYVVRM